MAMLQCAELFKVEDEPPSSSVVTLLPSWFSFFLPLWLWLEVKIASGFLRVPVTSHTYLRHKTTPSKKSAMMRCRRW